MCAFACVLRDNHLNRVGRKLHSYFWWPFKADEGLLGKIRANDFKSENLMKAENFEPAFKKPYCVSQKKVWCSKLTIILRMVQYNNAIL